MNYLKRVKRLPGNVRFFMLALALWGIPNSLVTSYSTLYMLEQGLTASQAGLINSICFTVKTGLSFFSGYVINKLGRRVTAGMIDLIGWGVYMLMLSGAEDFRMFLAAALVNCITTIGGVSTSCFMSEDVSQEDRIFAYTCTTIVSTSCSFVAPLAGIVISRYSLVPAMRGLYLFACVSMSLSALCKLFLLKETSIGDRLKAQGNRIRNPFAMFPDIIRYVLGNKRLLLLLSMNILLHFAANVNNLYYVPYLTEHLKFSEMTVSFFPFVTTIIGLFICFRVVPNVNLVSGMIASVILDALSIFWLIAASFAFRELAFLCVICKAIGTAMMGPLINTLIANNLKDELRTDVYGVFNTISMLCMLPAGYVGGRLFDLSPLFLVCFVFLIYLAGCVVLLVGNKKVFPQMPKERENR